MPPAAAVRRRRAAGGVEGDELAFGGGALSLSNYLVDARHGGDPLEFAVGVLVAGEVQLVVALLHELQGSGFYRQGRLDAGLHTVVVEVLPPVLLEEVLLGYPADIAEAHQEEVADQEYGIPRKGIKKARTVKILALRRKHFVFPSSPTKDRITDVNN